jgi:uncharacterized protein YndB with AHSA1/START domain
MIDNFARAARAVADLTAGEILATVEIAAPPERVFQALISSEIVDWWVRPGVFDTREWSGDARVGGKWRACGVARGEPYTLEGEFIEVDPPRKLVHTWNRAGAATPPTTVTYLLEAIAGGTRLTLRHTGFDSRESCTNVCLGWEKALERLIELLSGRA